MDPIQEQNSNSEALLTQQNLQINNDEANQYRQDYENKFATKPLANQVEPIPQQLIVERQVILVETEDDCDCGKICCYWFLRSLIGSIILTLIGYLARS